MRLCFLADARSIHTMRWVEYFAEEHEVDLITLDYAEKKNVIPEEAYKAINVKLHKVPRKLPSLLCTPLKIRSLIKRIEPDIVHAHYVTQYGFCGAFSGFHPLVVSAWGSDVLVDPGNSKVLKLMVKYALGKADAIYAVSGDIAGKIVSKFGISGEVVKIVPFGVDIELFQPTIRAEKTADSKIIVFSNRSFLKVYNIETLINAIPTVLEKNKNIHFVIKGSGPLEESLKGLASDLNVNDCVTFMGWSEYHEMLKHLRDCDIYVSTALSDGTPVSVLEAMACGKACIATDVGGVHEWIKDGVNGCLIPPQQPRVLAERILELSENPAKKEMLGKEAHRVVAEKGDWQKIMKQVSEDYKAMVGKI